MLLASCDYSIATIGYEFGQPPRIVYIANVDTELDFSEATLISIHRDGNRVEFPLVPSRWTVVEHSIDFTIPGIYRVEITIAERTELSLVYFVQVLNEEIFNQLANPPIAEADRDR